VQTSRPGETGWPFLRTCSQVILLIVLLGIYIIQTLLSLHTMSPSNNSFIASKPPHRQQRHPVAPQSRPILLPNLSPRPTLDEDQLGSPEFRDALQAAKQSRSNGGPSNHLLRSPLSSDPLPCHSSTTLLHDFEGDYDYTRRMQTCVAIRDNLKSPHHFQIMSLHEVKKLRGPVQPMPPAIPSRKLSTTRENRKTLLAPQSHEYTASYTTTSVSILCKCIVLTH
jgi:hypothetical protein